MHIGFDNCASKIFAFRKAHKTFRFEEWTDPEGSRQCWMFSGLMWYQVGPTVNKHFTAGFAVFNGNPLIVRIQTYFCRISSIFFCFSAICNPENCFARKVETFRGPITLKKCCCFAENKNFQSPIIYVLYNFNILIGIGVWQITNKIKEIRFKIFYIHLFLPPTKIVQNPVHK